MSAWILAAAIGLAGCEAKLGACSSTADCAPPASYCEGGKCVPGCAMSGMPCADGTSCDPMTGLCSQGARPDGGAGCTSDAECNAQSYCTQAGACAVSSLGSACAGGATVSPTCARKTTPADFMNCTGAAGPPACPYCVDSSCANFRLCANAADCHAGDACAAGLCIVQAPACPSLVTAAEILAGTFAAGKEMCVHDVVASMASGANGMIEVKLGAMMPFLYADVAPMYGNAVALPTAGQTATLHGAVRRNDMYMDWELLPVDWIGP